MDSSAQPPCDLSFSASTSTLSFESGSQRQQSSAFRWPQTTLVHAILLAKLDNVYRAYQIDPDLIAVDPEDTADVVALLAVAPFETLSHPKVMLLNPTFGSYSSVAGGADADLICGDLVVEVKTTKNAQLKPETIRQLLAYFVLARRARAEDGSFPAGAPRPKTSGGLLRQGERVSSSGKLYLAVM